MTDNLVIGRFGLFYGIKFMQIDAMRVIAKNNYES